MDEATLNDLKKFIAYAISQQISDVRDDIKRMENKMDEEFKDVRADIKNLDIKLNNKIDDLSDSVAQAIHDSNEEVDKQLQNHETRITKLEANPA